MASSTTHAQLTTLIVSPSDLKRAKRELETIDDFLHQAGLRQGGKAVKLPQISRIIEDLVQDAHANLLKASDRADLMKYIVELTEKAPVLHISFASEPSASFMNKLIIWLRSNIHPQVVVHLGLQPSIAAGCVIRTANKQFDCSLTQAFEKQRQVLVDNLKLDPTAASPEEAARIEAATLKAIKDKELATEAAA